MTRRWYSLCEYIKWGMFDGEYTRQPASLVHAKEPGTSVAACGLEAETWHRLWDIPFGVGQHRFCGECARVVGISAAR